MSNAETEWGWYVGHSEEIYIMGVYASREEAIQEAVNDRGFQDEDEDRNPIHSFYVIEATKPIIRLAEYFDASEWISDLEENQLAELASEDGDPIIDLTGEEEKTLQEAVRAALNKWQDEVKPKFKPWRFANTRNEEHIELRCTIDGELIDGEA